MKKTSAIVLAAALSVAMCLGLLAGCAPANEKDALDAAFSATFAEVEKQQAALEKELLMLKLASAAQSMEKSKIGMNLGFKSIDGVPDAQIYTALLGSSSIKLDMDIDTKASATQLDMVINLMGQELVNLYAYGSPDTLALGLPNLASTVVSVNPTTLAEDLSAAGLLDLSGLSEDELAELFGPLSSGLSPSYDIAGLTKVINEEWTKLYDQGDISHEGDTYIIELPGQAVAATLKALIQSVVAEAAKLYPDEISQEDIDDLFGDEDIPNMPTTVTVKVSNGLVTSFECVLGIDDPDLEGFSIKLTGAFDGASFSYQLNAGNGEGGLSLSLGQKATKEGYGLDLAFSFDDGWDAIDLAYSMTAGADGTMTTTFDMSDMVSVQATGKIYEQGSAIVAEYSDITITLSDDLTYMGDVKLQLSAGYSVEPFSGSITPTHEFTPLSTMDETALMNLAYEISTAFEAILAPFYAY